MEQVGKHDRAVVDPDEDSPLGAALAARDARTLDMVKEAVAHKQVLLAYQPVVTAAAPNTPVLHEALLRVIDETGRVIPAREFMTAVEEDELGRMLDCLALEKALATLAASPELRLSVNMSARTIGYPRWKDMLLHGLSQNPKIAGRLVLELSENSVLHVPELVRNFMNELQPRGIVFAIDDFGARYGTLRSFKDFFFDILKFDAKLIHDVQNDIELQAIAGGTATIARNLGMVTVAGHVEHPDAARVLAKLGVDCFQGFLFGPPSISPPWIKPSTAKGHHKNNSDAA